MALAEPLNQWRTVTEGCKPAFGVDVEDEDAAVVEVLVGTIEGLPPAAATPTGGSCPPGPDPMNTFRGVG
jgi:hypothetical protein